MNNKLAAWAMAITALVGVGSLQAHHSISMVEISTPIWIKGTVVRYEPVNPHAFIVLDKKRDDGQVQRWTVEGPILARLRRMDVGKDFLKAGDVIEVCGFPLKHDLLAQSSSRDIEGLSRPFMHGHMLVMPDGKMQPWGPYGKLDNCVRPEDRKQSWADFLNSDPIARELWCARASLPTRAVSKALVDEINNLLAKPCS